MTYSPGATLDAFLDSLPAASSRPVQVVLADNGSVDGAPERAAQARENVTLLRIGENVGYGAGANRGVAELGPGSAGWSWPTPTWSGGPARWTRCARRRGAGRGPARSAR